MNGALRTLTLVLVAFALAACSVLPMRGNASKGQKLDPWESWNRKVFSFNEELDADVLRPVATAYSELVPEFVRKSIDNFMSNVGDAWSAVNLLLQGRPKLAQVLVQVRVGCKIAVKGWRFAAVEPLCELFGDVAGCVIRIHRHEFVLVLRAEVDVEDAVNDPHLRGRRCAANAQRKKRGGNLLGRPERHAAHGRRPRAQARCRHRQHGRVARADGGATVILCDVNVLLYAYDAESPSRIW